MEEKLELMASRLDSRTAHEPCAIQGPRPTRRVLLRATDSGAGEPGRTGPRPRCGVFLREHGDHLTIHKLRTNRALPRSDLDELEKMLATSDVGVYGAVVEKAKRESHGLGLFVRSLVGLDREAAKAAFAGFLSGRKLTSSQIEFVDLIVNHLTEHGVMSAALLYESPFTDLAPRGPDGLFPSSQVDELVTILERVQAAAVAA